MKKLLLIALLMLALVVTAVACTGDPATNETTAGTTAGETPTEAPETPTEAPETPTEAPEVPTEAPDVPTEAPETQAPEVPTEAPETEPETEPETLDPMAPVNVFDAEALKPAGAQGVASAEIVDGALHIVPNTADPYWNAFSKVDGARYVVIRYRTDATGADIQFYLSSTGDGPANDDPMLRQPIVADSEWHLAIIDTQPLIDKGVYDGKFVSYFRFDPLEAGYILDENGQTQKDETGAYLRYSLPEGCSIDVEYIAFFNSAEAAVLYDAAPTVIVEADVLAEKAKGGIDMSSELQEGFVRLTSVGGDPYFQFISGAGVQPQYLAISYRTNSTMKGQFFIGSGAGPSGAGDNFEVDWNEGNWKLMVVDLTTTGVTSITDANINYLRLDFFTGAGAEGDYFDVQYVGFFNSAADAEAYFAVMGLQDKDIKDTFASDVASNEAGVNVQDSDLKNYFTFGFPLGSNCLIQEDGTYFIDAINEMYADMDGKYAFTTSILPGTASTGAMFVRGYHAVHSADLPAQEGDLYVINNYYETDGAGYHGGAGIFSTLADGNLYILVKQYVEDSKTHVGNFICSVPDMPADADLTMADDGDIVYILVNGELKATVALSGSTTYEKLTITPDGTFAKTAVVTLIDGTVHTVENTLVAATCHSQIGIAVRTGQIKFDAVKVEAFSAIGTPKFPAAAVTVDGDFADWADKAVTEIPVSKFIAWTGTAPEAFTLKTSFYSDGEYLYVYLNAGENSGATMYQICLITDNTVASDAAQAWYNVTFADGTAAIAGVSGACKGEPKVSMTGTEIEAAIPIAAIYGEGFALPVDTRILLVAQINGNTHMGTFHDGKNPNDDGWADRTGDGCPLTLNADGTYTIDLPAEPVVEDYEVPQDQWVISGHCTQIVGKEGHDNSPMVAAGGVESAALLHQGSIALGEIDLSKYSKVVIMWGSDNGAGTQDLYAKNANNRFALVNADKNMVMSPDEATIIAAVTYELHGWAVAAIEIDLTDIDYNGPVFLTHDSLPGGFALVSSIKFIA